MNRLDPPESWIDSIGCGLGIVAVLFWLAVIVVAAHFVIKYW